MGELCLSPIGLSMVSKLAAPQDTGLAQYATTYSQIAVAGFALGAAFLLFAPFINRLMHGVK